MVVSGCLGDSPRLRTPKRKMMMPLRKAQRTAKSGLRRTYGWIISAMMAVGPLNDKTR